MSRTDSLHYELCCKGATWIRQRKNGEPWHTPYFLSAVEIVTMGVEQPDIYATNSYISCNIEVKTSHSDFLADKKKASRQDGKFALGNFRYYLCPEGIIKEEEIPKEWGLLYYDGKAIRKVKQAKQQEASKKWDCMILTSILRREGMINKTYNYRKECITQD